MNIVTKLVAWALGFIPGLGPFASAIADVAVSLGAAEVADAAPVIKAVIEEAESKEDANGKPYDGLGKFAWASEQIALRLAEDQPKLLLSAVQSQTAMQLLVLLLKEGKL